MHQQEVKQATNAVRDAMRATQRLAKDIEAAKTALANEIEAPSSLKSTLVGEARERAYAQAASAARGDDQAEAAAKANGAGCAELRLMPPRAVCIETTYEPSAKEGERS